MTLACFPSPVLGICATAVQGLPASTEVSGQCFVGTREMEFQVVIDSAFIELWADSGLEPITNKRLLSLLNDFEAGKWRLDKFQNFIWDNIAETALSHRERTALSAQPASLLKGAARNLRLTDSGDDIGRGSELAEIVLYGIMKHIYGALSVVPKIFYKQNAQDNAKGADSVHIVIEPDGDFSLWFGEAKFYKSIEDARLAEVIKSVRNSLQADKLKKENSIVTSLSDLDDLDIPDAVRESIKDALSTRKSIDLLKPKIRVPILLLHECEKTASATELTDAYIESVREHHLDRALSYFSKQLKIMGDLHKYSSIRFHLILFPVPTKKDIVDKFVSEVQFYKV